MHRSLPKLNIFTLFCTVHSIGISFEQAKKSQKVTVSTEIGGPISYLSIAGPSEVDGQHVASLELEDLMQELRRERSLSFQQRGGRQKT